MTQTRKVASKRGHATGRDLRIGDNQQVVVNIINMASGLSSQKRKATPEQAEILALIKDMPERNQVLEFMKREFGTGLVIDIEGRELYRVRRYAETVRERGSNPTGNQDPEVKS
ncbi:MAG: hypothetical protein LBE62_03030 [Azonexus sp.]|jgi:hypothetical protein|nr:hypothetical protein [Azonexus sp.]